MLILMAGAPRSGTTLHFNMVQSLITAAGGAIQAHFAPSMETLEEILGKDSGADGLYQIVKHHFFDERLEALLRTSGAKGFIIHRNTLDSCASLLRKTGAPFSELLPSIRQTIDAKLRLLAMSGYETSQYEDVIAEPEVELERLAGHLGLNLDKSSFTEIAAKLSPDKLQALLKDSDFSRVEVPADSPWAMEVDSTGTAHVLVEERTNLHKDHFTSDGKEGRWSTTLDAREAATVLLEETSIAARLVADEQHNRRDLAQRLANSDAELARLRSETEAAEAKNAGLYQQLQSLQKELNGLQKESEQKLVLAAELYADEQRARHDAQKKVEEQELTISAYRSTIEELRITLRQQKHQRLSERAAWTAGLRNAAATAEEHREQLRQESAAHQRLSSKNDLITTQNRKLVEHANAMRRDIIAAHAAAAYRGGWRKKHNAQELPAVPPAHRFIEQPGDEHSTAATPLRFSIITPCFNAAKTIEKALDSVKDQQYDNYEHIVIDGGSNDGTIDILEARDDIFWVSEPDRNQVDAMNKGFARSSGDVIAYLNADDYFLPNVFGRVAREFKRSNALVVYGNVDVFSPHNNTTWTNEPRFDRVSTLYHWEPNAFCVNPVGYFYKRQVQEAVPLRESDGAKHDLGFLIGVAERFGDRSTKLDFSFGVFVNALGTQTANQQQTKQYWTAENFRLLDRFVDSLSAKDQALFRNAQAEGYTQRQQSMK